MLAAALNKHLNNPDHYVPDNIVHSSGDAKWIRDKEQLIRAPDYPWFSVHVSHCTCGCGWWLVILMKTDIGYVRPLLTKQYRTPLEAFVKYDKLVKECVNGEWGMLPPKEGESFD